MLWLRSIFIFSLLTTSFYVPVFGQTFPCDGDLLFITNQGSAPNVIYKVFMGPFGIIGYNPGSIFRNGHFDALGFNPTDNYIYGVKGNTNEIVRLKADGTVETLGKVALVDTLHSGAGDCTPDGYYICHDNGLDQILIFDVVDDFKLINRIDLFWDPASQNSGPFTTIIDDIAIDPNNPGVGYTFQGDYNDPDLKPDATRGYLHRINLDITDDNLGMVTPVAKIPSDVIRKLGSLFFTKEGGLFGYGSGIQGFNLLQNKLISIDRFTGNAYEIGLYGPTVLVTDGCSCPYSLTFENDAIPRDVLCTDSKITITLNINNRFYNGFENLTVSDTLPEGMIIEEVTGNFIGDLAPGTGIGTRYLTLNSLQIAPKEIVNINILARIIDLDIELIPNQAYLKNLPERLGMTMRSDDPQTVGSLGDPTRFYGTPQVLNDVEVNITHPTDCLQPNDAKVHISSSVLIAGEQYEVKLRDQDYDITSWEITIDDENSFLLENMSPGEYELFQITPRTSKCSFAMKDTTINIIAPNEQLKASVESNSPICESMPLQLSAMISPEGSISWSGPIGFLAEGQNPRIERTVFDQSGIYEMIATYGGCQQKRTLEVEVAPHIKASISGKEQYCDGDSMQLIANGIGDLRSFQWLGPDNTIDSLQEINISSMTFANEGLYQVIIDNGYCKDTAKTLVAVVASPKILLPDKIVTDFCNPLILKPIITGDDDVEYSWLPQEGLSCYNCPNPELQIPILNRFALKVVNEHSCMDSAEVAIHFLKDKLIYIPNAFSPNFDGINDYFQLSPGCGLVSINKVEIFDRYGTLIFGEGPIDYHNPRAFWDGTVGGKIGSLGVYIWRVEIELMDGTLQRLKGDVTLLR